MRMKLPRYHNAERFQKDRLAPERAQTGSASCTGEPERGCSACRTSVGSGQQGRRSQRGQGLGKPVAEPEGLIQRGCHCAERAAGDLEEDG